RKMARHPVENDAEPGLMTRVDKQLEVLRRPVSARRREETQYLIAPGAGEGVLHHRHQLDVSEPETLHVRHQPVRKLLVRQEAIALLGNPRPRSEMDLVDGHSAAEPAAVLTPRTHPRLVVPHVARDVADDRS